jgi:preprotein translocase SecF subunit
VFNLTSKKYLFFAISGLVILPGLLALIVWHLNLGIDFTGGATIDLRFANNFANGSFANSSVGAQAVAKVFSSAPFNAKDVQVIPSTDTSGGVPASRYVYIRFSRPIGTNEVDAVVAKLQDPKAKLPALVTDQVTNKPTVHTQYIVTQPNKDTPPYALMIVPFQAAVNAKDVQAALANLPATDPPPVTSSATPAATPSAAASPSATARAGATPTATPATSSSSLTFPVSVADVRLGANPFTYTVETQTDFTQTNVKKQVDLDAIVATLQQRYGYSYVQSSDQVGAAIASETTLWAFLAVAAASAAILVYIGIAFLKVGSWQQSFRYGTCAIIALLHDALVVLGLWAIFGHFFDFKVDTLFVTAILTVIGFSVHDTIVVFDRIRENMSRRTSENFEQVVNASLVQTMSRSLNTSLTVLFTLTALTLFGGASIRTFTLALLIGIASGTYSSIFNASMLLVVWENGEWRRWRILRVFGVRPKEQPVAYRRSLARAGAR